MRRALIVSSFVALSRVGGYAQALALAGLGIEAALAPTVLFGRHPGWGAPGGGAVGQEAFDGVLAGIEAQGGLVGLNLILTGYFATAGQVERAAQAIDAAQAGSGPSPLVIVDPVLGDDGPGLYVRPEVAEAIARLLVPRADLLRPNRWELERLSGRPVPDAAAAVEAARALGRPALVSSLPGGADRIGNLYVDERSAWLALHARAAIAPKGTGDLLTALYAAATLDGLDPPGAMARAVGGVLEAVEAAAAQGLTELPVAGMSDLFRAPGQAVELETRASPALPRSGGAVGEAD